MLDDAPDAPASLEVLLQAMARPKPPLRGPRRPADVHVDDPIWAEALGPPLAKTGVACDTRETPEAKEVLEDLESSLRDGRPAVSGLLDRDDVPLDCVARFFSAAADFYERAPWRLFPHEIPVAVRLSDPDGRWRYAVVMGVDETTFGLSLHDSWSSLQELRHDPFIDIRGPEQEHHAVLYGDITEFPIPDLEALEAHGWKVAGPEAYPIPVSVSSEGMRRPVAEELMRLEAILRALPDFLEGRLSGDALQGGRETVEVPTWEGVTQVELLIPAENKDAEGHPALEKVFRIKAYLKHRKGLWRRIEIRGDQTLGDLDAALREAFGHDALDHLGGFWIPRGHGKRSLDLGHVDPDGGGPAADLYVAQLELEPGRKLRYVYDFGDWIEHHLLLEEVMEPEEGAEYPREVGRNRPRYRYCAECGGRGEKVVATWQCVECLSKSGRPQAVCEECVMRDHDDHYVVQIIY
jgi:hypothetical protein